MRSFRSFLAAWRPPRETAVAEAGSVSASRISAAVLAAARPEASDLPRLLEALAASAPPLRLVISAVQAAGLHASAAFPRLLRPEYLAASAGDRHSAPQGCEAPTTEDSANCGKRLVSVREAISFAGGKSEVSQANRAVDALYTRRDFKIKGATQPLRSEEKTAAARRFARATIAISIHEVSAMWSREDAGRLMTPLSGEAMSSKERFLGDIAGADAKAATGISGLGGSFGPSSSATHFLTPSGPPVLTTHFGQPVPESILSGALWPADADFYAGDVYAGVGEDYSGDAGGDDGQNSSQQVAALCSGLAPGVIDLPVGRFERIIKPTSEQRAALGELKQAAAKASRVLETACPKQTPQMPVARLDAMEQRLAAMQQAVAIIRGPLERLYDLLNDEQKRRLEQAAGERNGRGAPSLDIAQLCSAQSGLTTVPTDEIARAISLSDEQQFDLNKLRDASEQAAQGLRASCPAGAPRSIRERLDAAQKRIAALVQAIEIVRPATSRFYTSLSEQQQAALKDKGRESRTARR